MKLMSFRITHIHSVLLLALAGAVLLAGCSRDSDPAAQAAIPEVRGERITAAEPRPPVASEGEQAPAEEITTAASAPAQPPSSGTAPDGAPEKIGEYLVVGFETLSTFDFEVSDELMAPDTEQLEDAKVKTEEQIPAKVKALDKMQVALQGYMLPLKVEGGLVTELLIMRDQSMCCYGTVPRINEWVSVKMVSKGVKPVMDQPVTLFGKLKVGEMRENGYLVGIYEMAGDKMADPLDL
jgi:hypothetical protein